MPRSTRQGRSISSTIFGIRLGNDPETILNKAESGGFSPEDIEHDPNRLCSDGDYQNSCPRYRGRDAGPI